MNLDPLIKAVQRAVGAEADGKDGPDTWQKIYRVITGKEWTQSGTAVVPQGDRVSDRSERVIATLLPQVQPYARALIHAAAAQGIKIEILSGTRTYAEQDALFRKGGVTKARGGHSNHNFGIAFDVGVFSGSRYIPESPAYKAVMAIGRSMGLECGGDWKSFVDEPHYQLRPSWAKGLPESQMLAELRQRVSAGKTVFA